MIGREICYGIVFLVEAIIALLYFGRLFKGRKSPVFSTIGFLIGYTILFILSHFDVILLNTSSFFVLNIAIVLVCYQIKPLTAVVQVAYLTFVMNLSEILIAVLMNVVFHDYTAYTYNTAAMITLAVLSKLLYFLVMMISARVQGRSSEKPLDSRSAILLSALPVETVIVSLAIIYIGMTIKTDALVETLMILAVLSLLIVNIVVWILYNWLQKTNEEHLNTQLALQKEQAEHQYYEMLGEQDHEQRVFIHDIKNHFIAMRELLADGRTDELAQYLEKVANAPAMRQRARYCDHPVLNIILLHYADICREKGIHLFCDIRKDCVGMMEATDMTTLFSNLLSNAVEAAEQSVEKSIDLAVSPMENSDYILLTVVNSCDHAPIKGADGRFVTRKADTLHHGLGSQSIRKVVRKYRGELHMYYDEDRRLFHSACQLLKY